MFYEKSNRIKVCISARGLVIALFLSVAAGEAFSQADFYKGKTIRILRGGGPGGSGEFQTRALMRILEKRTAGNPNFLLVFRPRRSREKSRQHHL